MKMCTIFVYDWVECLYSVYCTVSQAIWEALGLGWNLVHSLIASWWKLKNSLMLMPNFNVVFVPCWTCVFLSHCLWTSLHFMLPVPEMKLVRKGYSSLLPLVQTDCLLPRTSSNQVQFSFVCLCVFQHPSVPPVSRKSGGNAYNFPDCPRSEQTFGLCVWGRQNMSRAQEDWSSEMSVLGSSR